MVRPKPEDRRPETEDRSPETAIQFFVYPDPRESEEPEPACRPIAKNFAINLAKNFAINLMIIR